MFTHKVNNATKQVRVITFFNSYICFSWTRGIPRMLTFPKTALERKINIITDQTSFEMYTNVQKF